MVRLLLISILKNTKVMTILPSTAEKNKEFVDFLFGKLLSHVDTDMIDLQDDDSCCDHLQFEQLSLFS
jgi:hypothetical protein